MHVEVEVAPMAVEYLPAEQPVHVAAELAPDVEEYVPA